MKSPALFSTLLLAYFSRTGYTKPLAEYAAEYLDATLFEITAKIPYTDEDIAYYTDCRADLAPYYDMILEGNARALFGEKDFGGK